MVSAAAAWFGMNDLATWDHLLRLHVDQEGRVDYGAWNTEYRHTLAEWLAAQSASAERSAAVASRSDPMAMPAQW